MLLDDELRWADMGEDAVERATSRIGLHPRLASFIEDVWGIAELHPPQAAAAPHAIAGENLLLAIPTASGKSLVAHMAILNRLLHAGGRAIYIVPLKALAAEKHAELAEAGKHLGLKVGMAVGDRSGEAVSIDEADILVATSEKLDSMMRNRPRLLEAVSVVVADEIHLMHDRSRGPTLEVNLARLRLERPQAQIIGLSATVGNAEAIAAWLDAKLITSEWRPVTLRYGTLTENLVEPRKAAGPEADRALPPPFLLPEEKDAEAAALLDTVQDGGQLLVFRGSRRNAQASAKKLGNWLRKRMEKAPPVDDAEARLAAWAAVAEELANAEESTSMSDVLVAAVRGGVAFHHAGLTGKQRRIIEDAFRARTLVAIAATPTLAAGVNLPARRVLVRDLTRWEDGLSRPLPRMEVHQMLGRAGRPRFDPVGDAWLLCRSLEHADDIDLMYFQQPPEHVESKLAADPALRVHVLAAIATGGQHSRFALSRFFGETFLARSMPRDELESRIDEILHWLATHRFIERTGEDEAVRALAAEAHRAATPDAEEDWGDDTPAWAKAAGEWEGVDAEDWRQAKPKPRRPAVIGFTRATGLSATMPGGAQTPDDPAMTYAATRFGERVSRLYLDPLSGLILRRGHVRALEVLAGVRTDRTISPFALLHLIACTPDFPPSWASGAKQIEAMSARANAMRDQMLLDLVEVQRLWGGSAHEETALVKSADALGAWMDEDSLREIESRLKVAPGDLRVRVDHADWLLYAAGELLTHDDDLSEDAAQFRPELRDLLEITKKRVQHGCKQDLLALIALRNVGRRRARTMAKHGLRTPLDVIAMTPDESNALADERGWSPQLVANLTKEAERVAQRGSR